MASPRAPEASPTIAKVLEAIGLGRRFTLVVVVGPDEYPLLVWWTLVERLSLGGEEVVRASLEDAELDLAGIIAGSRSERPVVLVADPSSRETERRQELLVRLNLQRDAWADLPVRLVYWCSRQGLEELRAAAPDLLHWRALLAAPTATDLVVWNDRTYLAWCADRFRERDGDRVARGGLRAIRDPKVITLAGAGSEIFRCSQWVRANNRGVIIREKPRDAAYPVKEIAEGWARRALIGRPDAPIPMIVEATEVDELMKGNLSLGEVRLDHAVWRELVASRCVIFILDDDKSVSLENVEPLCRRGFRVFVVTEYETKWSETTLWARVVVSPEMDPLASGPAHDAVLALTQLFVQLFDPSGLRRLLLELRIADDEMPEQRVSHWHIAEHVVERLLRDGGIDGALFDMIVKLRPRARAAIEQVRSKFVLLGEGDDPTIEG